MNIYSPRKSESSLNIRVKYIYIWARVVRNYPRNDFNYGKTTACLDFCDFKVDFFSSFFPVACFDWSVEFRTFFSSSRTSTRLNGPPSITSTSSSSSSRVTMPRRSFSSRSFLSLIQNPVTNLWIVKKKYVNLYTLQYTLE